MMGVMKKVLKILLAVLIVVVLAAAAYVVYVFTDYHRIEDNVELEVVNRTSEKPVKGVKYTIVSYNIGFGAYEDDFGFFMDGGTQSWAWSTERLSANLGRIGNVLASFDADIYAIQEVDINSTRTYHYDERLFLREKLPGFSEVFALNYDSPFLMYPLTQPHGKSVSGLMTFASFGMDSAVRRSLPVETGFTKILDLDRCYTKSVMESNDGRLVIYNLHFSAYTSDGLIVQKQLEMILEDMQKEYEDGAWCIAAGDFNMDVARLSHEEYPWAKHVPQEIFMGYDIKLISPYNSSDGVFSCRNADGPYTEDQFRIVLDGFMISPNIRMESVKVVDTGFAYSDHNPVMMEFLLL